jgi:hypothetical protein
VSKITVAIRAAEFRDFDAIHAINQNAVPDVSSITLDELAALAKQCCYFGVADVDGEVAGFLMALRPGQIYQSMNYRWFSERHENFVYIDRIAVALAYKGRGIGRALYADVESLAVTTAPILTCEVNVVPPNADSMAFHKKLGFAEVGQQDTEGGTKRVSLMVKTLTAGQARL